METTAAGMKKIDGQFYNFLKKKKYLALIAVSLLLSITPAMTAWLLIDDFYSQSYSPLEQVSVGEWVQTDEYVYKAPTALVFAAALGGPIFYWAGWAAFLFVGGMLLGGRSTLRQIFYVVVIAWAPFALRGFLQSLFIVITRSPIINPGLSGFGLEALPGDWGASFLNHILSYIEVYLPVHLVLLVNFGGQAAGLNRKQSVKLVMVGVLLLAVLTYLPGLLSMVIADWASNSAF